MKITPSLFCLLTIFSLASCEKRSSNAADIEKSQEWYQLKIYTLDTDVQVETVDNYLKDAFLPGLKRQGITSVGVFKPHPNEADSAKKIFVLIPFASMQQFVEHEELLAKDEAYLKTGENYLTAPHDQAPYNRIESILLKAFENMPVMKAPTFDSPRPDRIYELRSYESATEAYYKSKVDMFNAGGEIGIFDSLDFNAVFYAEVVSGPKMPNLMYMTTFSDQASRDAHWDSFSNAPAWKELKTVAKYQNTVSHADRYFLYPTAYSDY